MGKEVFNCSGTSQYLRVVRFKFLFSRRPIPFFNPLENINGFDEKVNNRYKGISFEHLCTRVHPEPNIYIKFQSFWRYFPP